jgi:hypothetical protein
MKRVLLIIFILSVILMESYGQKPTTVSDLWITNTPVRNDTLSQILVRDPGTNGKIRYRMASSLGEFWPLSGTFSGATEIDADGNTVQINNTGGFTLQSNAANVIRSDDNPSYVFSVDTDTGEESGLDVGHNYGVRLYYTPDALTTERLVEVNSSSVDVINRTSSGKVFKITTEDPGNWVISSTYYHAYAETTDATPTILFSFETESDKSYFIEGVVVARRTGGTGGSAGDSFASNFRVVVKNISGTASLVSGGGIIGTIQDNNMNPWNLNPGTSGNEFRLTVTGIADNNITWRLGECKVIEAF